MKWYSPPQKRVDTVVFVHGILGHYITSWGKFPKLLTDDQDLPQLDILMWGYRTGWFSRHNELRIEGAQLVTALQSLVPADSAIVLVGHSMGGLIILKGLVDRMGMGEAQLHPCRAITWITLFASPLNGVWLSGLLHRWAALPLRALKSLHKHLHDLSRGPFVNDLLAAVRRHIYAPAAEDQNNRRIPIRIVAATRDKAVDKEDRDFALTPYTNPAAQQLDATHRKVKLPKSHEDLRYRVLSVDLQVAITRTFKRLCVTVQDARTTADDREVAFEEMRTRYGKLIRLRLGKIKIPENLLESAENELLLLIAAYGLRHDEPPFSVVHRAVTALVGRHKDWR
jgi:pimeloyl-ACP methyl ester carboxylesterase